MQEGRPTTKGVRKEMSETFKIEWDNSGWVM